MKILLERFVIMKGASRFFSGGAVPRVPSARNGSCSQEKSNPNLFLFNYLIDNLGFSQSTARSISNRFAHVTSPNKPDAALSLLRRSGFSPSHVRDTVRVTPQILLADPDRTLRPKLEVLQELGLGGSDLGLFVSKASTLLTANLERKLRPSIEILKQILPDRAHLVKALRRCTWLVLRDPEARLLPNISLLRQCGIVDSQLSTLLRRNPRLFSASDRTLRDLIDRVKGMGFSTDSRMFVHALHSVSSLTTERLQRKVRLLESAGLSREESAEMFRRAPSLMRTSEEKLEAGARFFAGVLGEGRSALVRNPVCLMYSVEKRLLPRYRVVRFLLSKMVLKKQPSIMNVVMMTEREFLLKYIFKYDGGDGEVAEELLLAYKGRELKTAAGV